jgi:hypothetical protein
VESLPQKEQWSLLAWLQTRLTGKGERSSIDREQWLKELAHLRSKNGIHSAGIPMQELLDEVREERL